MSNNNQSSVEDLAYWKNNAEENYMTTPISVLKYIAELENHIETIKAQLPSDEEIGKLRDEHIPIDEENMWSERFYFTIGAKSMRNKIQEVKK